MSFKENTKDTLSRVPRALGFARLVMQTVRVCLRYRVTGLASEAAFFMLLSLPPLVLGLFGGMGYAARWLGDDTVNRVIGQIEDFASQFLTESSLTQILVPTIDDVLRHGRADLVSVGFLLSLWSGSRALNVFIDTISIMYGQSGERGIIRTRLLSLTMYALSLIIAAIVLPLVLAGPEYVKEWLPSNVSFLTGLYWPVVGIGSLIGLSGLYHIATPKRSPWLRDIPGAVVAFLLLWLVSFVVRRTLEASLGGSSIYGPLTTPIVLLIWLYFIAIVVLIGAAFNAATRELWPIGSPHLPTTRLINAAKARGTGVRRGRLDPGPGQVAPNDDESSEEEGERRRDEAADEQQFTRRRRRK